VTKPAPVIYEPNASDQWYTPEALRSLARRVLLRPAGARLAEQIDLDPATSSANPLRAQVFYTQDALARSWRPNNAGDPWSVWLNPPYGREIKLWTQKLVELAALEPQARILSLLPARPGASWYARATNPSTIGGTPANACQLLCELHGRVTFELADGTPAPYPARWGSVLLYWGPDRVRAARLLRRVGVVRFGSACLARNASTDDPRQLRLIP
jgi:hypothetical protein